MNTCRRFVLAFAVSTLAAPVLSLAQSPGPAVRRIGILWPISRQQAAVDATTQFLQGLRDLGYVDGRTVLSVDGRADPATCSGATSKPVRAT